MTRPRPYVVFVSTLTLASCLLLAQQAVPTPPYNTQGVTPPPGSNPTPAKMTFFVTSVGIGKGGNLGGPAGAGAGCRRRRSCLARLSEHAGSSRAARRQRARPHRHRALVQLVVRATGP